METNNRICERNKMGLVQFMWNSFFFGGVGGGGGCCTIKTLSILVDLAFV